MCGLGAAAEGEEAVSKDTTGGMFPDWYAEQLAAHPELQLPERIRKMHRMYGLSKSHTCGKCKFFLRFHQSTTWFKCDLTTFTGGAATDWRAKWPACGKWEESEE